MSKEPHHLVTAFIRTFLVQVQPDGTFKLHEIALGGLSGCSAFGLLFQDFFYLHCSFSFNALFSADNICKDPFDC